MTFRDREKERYPNSEIEGASYMAHHSGFDRSRFVDSVAENSNEAVRNALYELLDFGEKYAEELRNGQATVGSIHYAVSVGNILGQ